MPAYIAVFEIHARPDTSKPAVIVPSGKPLVCSADYAKDLLGMGALRPPTEDEIKIFGLKADASAKEDAPTKKAPEAPKKAAEPTKAGGAKKPAEKPAEGADTAAGGAGDDTTAGDDDGTNMV
jgi:hypothetical protein